ncbi:hypothetical protein NFI96_007594 [Prochilodus magdalenae]|nr:hypothetical protein NFI96_007594 [Prochilodus magdalenae]
MRATLDLSISETGAGGLVMVEGGDVCYAALDLPSRGQKPLKKKKRRVESVLFSRISGAEVEMRVRPGENIILYSDCVLKPGTFTVWFRKSSDEDQTPLIISADVLIQPAFSRRHFIKNPSISTRDLLVTNVSESDLGLYYCAVRERKSIKGVQRDVYLNGTRTTRLSLLDPPVPCVDLPYIPSTPSTLEEHSTLQTTSTPPVSDCSVCWKLLVSVCPVCVLLSSVVSSTCIYCICRKRTEAVEEENQREGEKSPNQQIRTREEVGGGDVCYAALDLPSRGQKPLKKKKRRVESSEFSTYSETGVSGLVKVEELIQDLIGTLEDLRSQFSGTVKKLKLAQSSSASHTRSWNLLWYEKKTVKGPEPVGEQENRKNQM